MLASTRRTYDHEPKSYRWTVREDKDNVHHGFTWTRKGAERAARKFVAKKAKANR